MAVRRFLWILISLETSITLEETTPNDDHLVKNRLYASGMRREGDTERGSVGYVRNSALPVLGTANVTG